MPPSNWQIYVVFASFLFAVHEVEHWYKLYQQAQKRRTELGQEQLEMAQKQMPLKKKLEPSQASDSPSSSHTASEEKHNVLDDSHRTKDPKVRLEQESVLFRFSEEFRLFGVSFSWSCRL